MSSEKCLITIFAIRNTTAVKFYYRPISQFPQNTNNHNVVESKDFVDTKYYNHILAAFDRLVHITNITYQKLAAAGSSVSGVDRWGRTLPWAFWTFGCSLLPSFFTVMTY